jgi:hypothetical protein
MAKTQQQDRTHPALWERSKRDAIAKMGGKFSARAMQLAVRLYKSRGGGYKTSKSQDNSLVRWTAENWGYVGKFLPQKVRERLTPSEKRRTNLAKRKAQSQWSPQPKDVALKTSRIRKAPRKAPRQPRPPRQLPTRKR